jgi:hypothetical protein
MLTNDISSQVLNFAELARAERLNIHVYRLHEEAPAEEYDEEASRPGRSVYSALSARMPTDCR